MALSAKIKRLPYLVLAIAILFQYGCSRVRSDIQVEFKSYKDIPGVTQEEIAAIDRLLIEKPRLNYGFCVSTEAFLNEDGSVGGFAALLCERMTELLGFEFNFTLCSWEELNKKIESYEIDLVSDFSPTPERKKKFIMTEAIIQRVLKIYTHRNTDLDLIAKTRLIKCAFMNGSTTFSHVDETWSPLFEAFFVDDQAQIPTMLLSGEIDAFIEEGTIEAAFDGYSFIETKEYYPLTYSPVSLTTRNPEIAPIISVMQKYLDNGGSYELTNIYKQGYSEYLKNKLFANLTDEEKQYISEHKTKELAIPAAYETDAYPLSFYNKREAQFQGAAVDALKQISDLTGLVFEPKNAVNSTRRDLVNGLASGEYSLLSTLIKTEEREKICLFSNAYYDSSQYALLSRTDYPDIDINQVLFATVGLLEDTAYKEAFLTWFPDSVSMRSYRNNEDALAALEKGEIDLLMSSMDVLLHVTNYLEKTNFKANIVFRYPADSYFAFGKDEEILCSIISKAQRYIDVEVITNNWKLRAFDYENKMFRDMFPFIVIIAILLASGLATIFIFYVKNRRINKHLGELVEERTSELAAQESLLATIFNSIPDLIFTKDTNGKFLGCNKRFERHFQCKEEDIIGKGDIDGLHLSPELAKMHTDTNEKVMRTREMAVVEEILPSADGTNPYFETIRIPLIKDDTAVGMVGIARDITERKAVEDTLKLTLDNLNTCIYISEIDTGKILFINEKMASEFGGNANEFMGKVCWKVLQDNFAEQCEFCPVPKLLESGDEFYVWEEHNTVTGRHYKNMDSLVKWPNGKLVHMQHSVDITDSVKLQQDLEHASHAKSDFLSRMSHEMRTPLSAIIGMNNIAMNTENLEKIRHCHERIDNASRNLLGIINDILDMSKIEADKFELSYSEFEFDKMLMNITNIINLRVDEKHQELVVNLNENVPMLVYGDELRLTQVIMNLLSNAVKFTPERGTIVLGVNCVSEVDSDIQLRIEVADTGIGITQEQRQRLFTSFEQADSSITRRFGGTGLGLAISKRIVELMGGQIWVESEYGNGSTFIFTANLKKARQKLSASLSVEINKNNIHILAVDDCQETLDYFAHVMGSHNLPFAIARSGEEAIKLIDENLDGKPFNMFFVDWKMPGMNGIELSKRIKEVTGNKSVIFMISVADWNVIEKEATAAGVNHFITKPLFASMLINAINECLTIDHSANSASQDLGYVCQHKYPGHTILIAEDIEINREIMSAIFEETEIAIDYAVNGVEAVNMFEEAPEKYSLILMDIHMPEMDGFLATRAIRALKIDKASRIPIIAMTANVFREDIENCLAAGMDDHIGKPVEQDTLFAKLDKYLARV